MLWLNMEGGLMKFLVRNARGKIIEDAEEKRDSLIQTFQVRKLTDQIVYAKSCLFRNTSTTNTQNMLLYFTSAKPATFSLSSPKYSLSIGLSTTSFLVMAPRFGSTIHCHLKKGSCKISTQCVRLFLGLLLVIL